MAQIATHGQFWLLYIIYKLLLNVKQADLSREFMIMAILVNYVLNSDCSTELSN